MGTEEHLSGCVAYSSNVYWWWMEIATVCKSNLSRAGSKRANRLSVMAVMHRCERFLPGCWRVFWNFYGYTKLLVKAKWFRMTFVQVTDFPGCKLEWWVILIHPGYSVSWMCEDVVVDCDISFWIFCLQGLNDFEFYANEFVLFGDCVKMSRRIGQWSMTFARDRNCTAGKWKRCVLEM